MEKQDIFSYFSNDIREWCPTSGWNPSFFAKDKIFCTSCFWYLVENGETVKSAERIALKKTFERKLNSKA